MGTYYTCDATRADIIAEICKGHVKCSGPSREVTRRALSGNTLWTCETIFDESGEVITRFIGCYLLKRAGNKREGFYWGYKPLDETMGLNEVTCPLAFLSEVPCSGHKFAVAWRERVREYHALRAESRKLARTGNLVRVWHCTSAGPFRVISENPLRGMDVKTGIVYKLPRLRLLKGENNGTD